MSYENRYATTEHSANYQRYRPTYPNKLYELINKTIREKVQPELGRFKGLAIDVGCGSGQSTRNLAPYFERVLGIDISPTQIDQARKSNTLQNVEYKVSRFDEMLVDDNSCCLVTCASAAHWFNPVEDFYKEANRVLKPGGVLAIMGYILPVIYKDGKPMESFTKALVECDNDERVDRLKDDPIRVAGLALRDFVLPYSGWKRIDDIHSDIDCSLMDVVRILSTGTYYVKYKNEHPDKPGPLDDLQTRYAEMIGPGATLENYKVTMRLPMYLLIGQKP